MNSPYILECLNHLDAFHVRLDAFYVYLDTFNIYLYAFHIYGTVQMQRPTRE